MLPVCPKCDTALFILQWKGVEVDFCPRCRGLWLDAGELEALLERAGATSDDPLLQGLTARARRAPGRAYLCPRCDEPMQQCDPLPTLTLERCGRGHGLWLDSGELRQLLCAFSPGSDAGKTVAFLNEFFQPSAKT